MAVGPYARTLQPKTRASRPGCMTLSHEKLRALRPDLYGFRSVVRHGLAGRRRDREYIGRQLQRGDSRAAVVVSTAPLLIAAYTDELDCVVMLRLPDEFTGRYELSARSRLLTVNFYGKDSKHADVVPGQRCTGRWMAIHPLIADFLTDDYDRLRDLKSRIPESEWARAFQMGQEYLQSHPGVARDGRPIYAGIPAAIPGHANSHTRERLAVVGCAVFGITVILATAFGIALLMGLKI